MTDDRTYHSGKVLLTPMRTALSEIVSKSSLENLTLSTEEVLSDVAQGLRVSLEAQVLSEKICSGVYPATGWIEFPASPWQFFKQRHAESWWLRWLVERRPVRRQRHGVNMAAVVDTYRTYPEARYQIPDLGHPVIVETLEWTRE